MSTFQLTTVRLKVTIPIDEELVFLGDELSLHLMFLENRAISHIVDTATRFPTAIYLDSNEAT